MADEAESSRGVLTGWRLEGFIVLAIRQPGANEKGGDVEVSVGPPVVSAHFDDEVVVCELSGEISSTKEQGYFAADTRLVSGSRLNLGGERPILLDGAATGNHSAR